MVSEDIRETTKKMAAVKKYIVVGIGVLISFLLLAFFIINWVIFPTPSATCLALNNTASDKEKRDFLVRWANTVAANREYVKFLDRTRVPPDKVENTFNEMGLDISIFIGDKNGHLKKIFFIDLVGERIPGEKYLQPENVHYVQFHIGRDYLEVKVNGITEDRGVAVGDFIEIGGALKYRVTKYDEIVSVFCD